MKHCLIIAITLLLPHVAVAANLVQNGSFEDPIQGPGTWSVQSGVTGWTVISDTGGVEIRNNNAGVASDGVNFVELDANSNSAIEQSFATIAGSLYDLAFDYSPRIFQPASTNGVSVFWNGGLLASLTGDGGTENIWESHQFSVTGTGGNNTLRFEATGTSDSLGGNIDNVSLDVNEVPIPAALWLMGSALGLLGFIPKRKSA
jgi:hypothetical protein